MSDFRMLLRNELPRLIRYAAALTRDADQALDLVEDTVLEALSSDNPNHSLSEADLRVWLLTILHDQRGNPFRQAGILTPASRSERDPVSAMTQSDFDRELGQLPEEQRAVLLLIGLEGLRHAEAAAILRVSVGTVRSRLDRARQALCRALGVSEDLASVA